MINKRSKQECNNNKNNKQQQTIKMTQNSKQFSKELLLFVLFSNIIFVFWWFHNYFGYFKAKLTNLYIYIEKFLNKFGRKTIQKNQTFLNFKTNFVAFEKKKDLVESAS